MWRSIFRRLLRHIKEELIQAVAEFLDEQFNDQQTPAADPTKVAPLKPKE